MADMCGDNRFEIIASAKKALLEGTNIDMCPDGMAVIDNILFRCWQMGWLDRYDRKDEPQTERPSCETCKWDSEEWDGEHCDSCVVHTDKPSNYEPQTDCAWK